MFFNPYPEENALKLKYWDDMISMNKSGIRCLWNACSYQTTGYSIKEG